MLFSLLAFQMAVLLFRDGVLLAWTVILYVYDADTIAINLSLSAVIT